MAKKKTPVEEVKPRIRVKAYTRPSEFMNQKPTGHMAVDPFQTGTQGNYLKSTPDFASVHGRRGPETRGLSTGPATTNIINGAVARYRSRYAVLTNPHAKRAIDVLVSNVIGTGHRFISLAPNAEFKKKLEDLWAEWCLVSDSVGQLDFYGLEALTFRSMAEGGDCFVRMRPRRPVDGLPVPLQLQLYEAEQVPIIKNERTAQDNLIIGGIEFNVLGRPVAYHMTPFHPGEFMSLMALNSIETIPVPAESILHIHEIRRPNDVRGMPFLSQVLIALSDLDRYLDAEMMRKKAAALIGGFITTPIDASGANPFLTKKKTTDWQEVEIEAMEPGTFPLLPPGYGVENSQPADVGQNFAIFLKHYLMKIATGLNQTYEQLSGDLRDINDRSLRASLLEFKRVCKQYQNHVMEFQFCRKVFDRWFELGVLSGAIVIPEGMRYEDAKKSQWIPDPWDYLNPNQEITAIKDEIRIGLKARSDFIRERGDNPEEVDAKYAEDKKRADALGLVFDSDPSKVSGAGNTQFIDPNALDESAPIPDKDAGGNSSAPPQEPIDNTGDNYVET